MIKTSTARDLNKTPCARARDFVGPLGARRGVGSSKCIGGRAGTGHLRPAAQARREACAARTRAAQGQLFVQDSHLTQRIRGIYACALSRAEAPATPTLAAAP
jgi:hypothetical protein